MAGRLQPGTEHPGELLLTGPCHIDVLYREQANKGERESVELRKYFYYLLLKDNLIIDNKC